MSNARHIAIVENPQHLAKQINSAHQEVLYHGRGMLVAAAKAGRYLISVKKMLKHGEFGPWVKANCIFSYKTAAKYMKVAKNLDPETFDVAGGVDAFLGYNKPRSKFPEASPTLTREDAEYILKLHAVTERGGTENERDVARSKLADFAGRFGMREDVAVDWARSKLPDNGKTSYQAEAEGAQAEANALRSQLEKIMFRSTELKKQCSKLSRQELEDAYIGLVLEREGLSRIK